MASLARAILVAAAVPVLAAATQSPPTDLPALASHGLIPFGGFTPGLPVVVVVHGADGQPGNFENLARGLKAGEEHNIFFYVYEDDMIAGAAARSRTAAPLLHDHVDSLETFAEAKDGLVDAVRELVRQTGTTSISLIGHSAGGVMSWAAVSRGTGKSLADDPIHVDLFAVDPPARGLSGMSGAASWSISSIFTRQFGGFWDVMGSPSDLIFTGQTGANATTYLFHSPEDDVVTDEGQMPASGNRKPDHVIRIGGTHVGAITDPLNVGTIVSEVKDAEAQRATAHAAIERTPGDALPPAAPTPPAGGAAAAGSTGAAGEGARSPHTASPSPGTGSSAAASGVPESPARPPDTTGAMNDATRANGLGRGTNDFGRALTDARSNLCCESGVQPLILHATAALLGSRRPAPPPSLALAAFRFRDVLVAPWHAGRPSASVRADLAMAPALRLGSGVRSLASPSQSTSAPGAMTIITSLGTSQGDAFEVQVVNDGASPVRLSADGVVVEPLKRQALSQVARAAERRFGKALKSATTTRVEGYCLAHDLDVPSTGMLYRVAPPALQAKFRPAAAALEAAERVERAGGLHPDSDPKAYVESIKQYSVWTTVEGWDERAFTNAWIDRTKKTAAALKRRWTDAMESALRGAAPNRWRDIQTILAEAGTH